MTKCQYLYVFISGISFIISVFINFFNLNLLLLLVEILYFSKCAWIQYFQVLSISKNTFPLSYNPDSDLVRHKTLA